MVLDYFLTVSKQVVILFMLIGVGFICGKIGFMNKSTAKNITDIVLYFVTPCVIINAYQVDFNHEILINLGITALCAIGAHIVSIIIVTLVFRGKDIDKKAVLRFGTVFSNCGFMSLPLQQAIIGQEGVLYGAAFVGVFNIFLWTYGVICMSGDKKGISAKSLLLNPGILGVVIALIFFLLSFRLPDVIGQPVKYLASLNTPLPMFIIGFYLSSSKISSGLKDKNAWLSALIRLIAIPVIFISIMYLLGVRDNILITVAIAVSAPIAATTTMFATKFNKDTELSVNLVSLSTILSIVTMSCIVAITQMIS
ncbi:MAG: AEC family transporter [Acutalibacteraceae bacterium]|nr:AEC family transporter [Acutalibacteraceae bacterium]